MIRIATLDDIEEVSNLYCNTIRTVNLADYTEDQVNVWANRGENVAAWVKMITGHYFIVEEDNGVITGFSSLTEDGCVFMMYVHQSYQRRGIAKRLLEHIVSRARQLNMSKLTSEASITARPFFELMGFVVDTEQTIVADGVELNNFKMYKLLD